MIAFPSQAVFDRIRQGLRAAGFLEESIAQRLQAIAAGDDALGVLVSLFFAGRACGLENAARALPTLLPMLTEAGLLEQDGDEIRAAALLYPVEDLWIASDLPGRERGGDFVFPAISPQTQQFQSILPDRPCEALLDLGCGAGAATLIAANDYAQAAYGGDISARSIRFAEFNRRLNGVENASFDESDLYAAFADRDFDRIIAHPPYIPSLDGDEAYRHGGPLGESVLERILAGLGDRLRPGGRAYLSCLGCDTAEAPLEERLAAMLGPARDEFAILVAEWETLPAVEFVMRLVEAGELDFDRAQRQVTAFRQAGATQLVRCAIVAARHQPAPHDGPRLMRRRMGERTTGAELDAAIDAACDAPAPAIAALLDQKLSAAPGLRLERESVLHGGDWRETSIVLDAQHPFEFRTDCPLWAADLLPHLDGTKTPRDLLDADVDQEEAEIFLECLLAAGVVEGES